MTRSSVCIAAAVVVCSALLLAGASPKPQAAASPPRAPDAIAEFLSTPFPPADGFDFPVGDADGNGSYLDVDGRAHAGWYIATRFGEKYALGIHPGEDWNGKGGGDTDLGQPVHAIGAGRVVEAGTFEDPFGGIVVVEHVFYEDAGKRTIRSVYVHLSRIDVKAGELVTRRQVLGAIGKDPGGSYPAHLHLELRTDATLSATFWPSSDGWDAEKIAGAYVDPSAFIRARRTLFVPQNERSLLVMHHATRRLRLYERGALSAEYDIGIGQAEGAKEVRGDLKTPVGMYFVVSKSEGPFSGDYADYYGGYWIKVNYPNAYDAERGLAAGLVSEAQRDDIARAWAARKLTLQGTKLGSGIGFHGWVDDWSADAGTLLSWGCVVMHNSDIAKLYPRVAPGTMVVLLP